MNTSKIVLPNAIMLGEVSRFLDEGREVIIMTKGNSMSPFIRGERDSVELRKRPQVEAGDIVLAQLTPGHYVLHRVKQIDGERVTLKGDGNLDGTERCTLGDICGTVTYIIRPGDRRLDCYSRKWQRRFRRWTSAPRGIRRIILAIYRRIKIL